MTTEVYIDGSLVDIDEEETIAATYGNISFGQLSKRKGVKSNTYTLPFSQRNKLIYEGCEVRGSYSVKPYRRGVIEVKISGVTVFEGWCVLDQSQNGYEVQSFAGASDFYTQINNRKLVDLDLSAWDHVWNEPNIKSSWTRTEGYNYSFVEYGKEFAFDTIPPDYLLPQIFFHTVVRQIAADAGYTLIGDVLDNPRFLAHVIIPNKFPLTVNYGGDMSLTDLLPDVTQSKVWLDFANMYGQQFDINDFTKEIRCSYIDDVLFSEPQDWTSKVDTSEERKVRYRFDSMGQNTILKYKSETVESSVNAASQDFRKTIVVDDEVLQEEATLYESQFFLVQDIDPTIPTSRVITRTFTTKAGKGFSGIWQDDLTYVGGVVFYNGTYYESLQQSGNLNKVPPAEPTYWKAIAEKDVWDIKNRPMYGILEINPVLTLQVAFPTPVTITRIVNNTNMDWSYIYQHHYRVFDRMKDRTKRVTELVKISYSDINQLAFNRSKRIDNELYYLEEVSQFKLNKKDSTYVELVRI
jgi:hypothetical protein